MPSSSMLKSWGSTPELRIVSGTGAPLAIDKELGVNAKSVMSISAVWLEMLPTGVAAPVSVGVAGGIALRSHFRMAPLGGLPAGEVVMTTAYRLPWLSKAM